MTATAHPAPARPILVDSRVGSKEIEPFLISQKLPTELLTLDYGDFAFEGNGPDGPVLVGVERKRLTDLLSSMRTGRLAGHQLQGLLSTYSPTYLIVEGIFRCGHDNVLETPGWSRDMSGLGRGWIPVRVGTQGFLFSEMDNFLTSLENIAGLKIRYTSSKTQTAQTLASLYAWWGKPWAKHRSLGVVYTPAPPTIDLVEPSLLRKIAVQLPGVGWEKATAVERKWRTVVDMLLAEVQEWETLPGFGKVLANRIVNALRTNQDEE